MTMFTVYPAIDLKGGRCVRLLHGEMKSATVYNDDPAAQARDFEQQGFEWLHIVDLDGAFSGESENADAVAAILAAATLKTQLGGGIRTMAAIDAWLGRGVTRVILGTAAVRDPELVRDAAARYPAQIVVGIDAKGDRVKTDGWGGDTGHSAAEIAKRYEDQGVGAIVYTDIGRDGALAGVNVAATGALSRAVGIPVIASGGVASIADISALRCEDGDIDGVVIGRALYDGRIDAKAALAAARAKSS